MTDRFACEFMLDAYYDGETLAYESYSPTLVSSVMDLDSRCDINFDLLEVFMEDDAVINLKEGTYHVFMQGTVFYNHEMDWETGIDDGGWIFEWKDINIERMKK